MKINKGFLALILFSIVAGCFYMWALENWRIGCAICWVACPIIGSALCCWAEYEHEKNTF